MQWQGADLLLQLHIQPGAKTSGFAGMHGEALKIRIQAPPLEGRANRELCRFLAGAFGVPAARVVLLSGEGSRHKRVCVLAPASFPAELVTCLPPRP